MDEEMQATSFPSHGEIILPTNQIVIEVDDVNRGGENISPKNVSDDGTAEVENINEINRDTTHIKKKLTISVDNDMSNYDKIEHIKESAHSPSEKSVTSPMTPTSMYKLGGSNKRPKLELKEREISTRQCKFEIGEEWEEFQIIHHDKSVSCPPSPLIGRKHDDVIENGGRVNKGYAASEPGAEIEQNLSDSADKTKDPFPFHFLFTSTSATPLKECHIVPNPYNKANQRFHSTLQCPCFLFFFFLCCLPAVHLMQQSDRQFKKGNNKRARNYGKVSTILYIVGSVFGVTFLAVAIYFAADYVKQFV